MSASVATYEIGLDTPIHLLTPRQLFAMQKEWMERESPAPQPAERGDGRWYVNSMDELAAILGTSKSTAYRMKAEGLLDDAISQYGRWMCIDVERVLETFRLSGRSGRARRTATRKKG